MLTHVICGEETHFVRQREQKKLFINCHKRDPKSDEMTVIASKHLIPGDVVFKCKPLMTIDWTFHKNECKVFREKTMTESDAVLQPFHRLFLRIKNDKTFATKRHTLIDGSVRHMSGDETNKSFLCPKHGFHLQSKCDQQMD
ncbi:unnamed protein product [Medioppia subpectinata]|uniref:Uncharacterized protein n=1 Tax=Medioppia subpectinata TaxID=1979941 RepID=A0A7R9KUP3_9ACAR|nr:unnamed protein product [Medioppia subpectinata]CAG2110040.1 unnamed protein product [Medioppia subpectinata]